MNQFDPNRSNVPFGENNNVPRADSIFSWDGESHNKKQKRKNFRTYFLTLAVSVLVAAVLIAVSVTGSLGGGGTSDGGTISVPEVIVADTSSGDTSASYADGESTDLSALYEKCAPSCCTVYVTYSGTEGYSIGSGFVISSENGYIATNHHVIEGAGAIKVVFYDGREYEAKLVGSDSTSDLAVLKVEAKGLPQIALGISDDLKVGQSVVAIGTPYSTELAGTMTKGIISGIARDIKITNDYGTVVKTMTLIQTDCTINPGNSGGPLIDMNGRVVGINSLKIASENYENIGFAIPITSAIKIFNQLIAGEKVDSDFATASARLGITVYQLEAGLETFRINPRCEYPKGLLVAELEVNTAIYTAGLEMFDIITEFNGEKIEELDDLTNALAKCKAGDNATVKVFRFNRTFTAGENIELKFVLDAAT